MKIDKNKIKEILKNLDLNKNEIAIYLILSDRDFISVRELYKLSNLKRSNLYNILNLLKEKNLIEEFEKNKKKHFRLLNPINIKNLINVKKTAIEELDSKIDNVLPNLLNNFQLISSKPAVYYFEGFDGIKNLYRKILKERKTLYIFTSRYERKNPEFVKLLLNQIKEQYKRRIKVLALTGKYLNSKEIKERKEYLAYVKTVKNLSIDSEIIIFGNNVAITTFKNQDFLTTLIVNNNISQTFRNIFKCLWYTAENPNTYI